MTPEIARLWFIPGEGIDRHVISADIQRYLGNDATVRPGVNNNETPGVQGFWIKAYRNLTTAMIEDLKADSARWRTEQRQTGTRGSQSPFYPSDTPGMIKLPDPLSEPYVGSTTHRTSAGRTPHSRREGESPGVEGAYGTPATTRDPRDRMQVDSRMQIDQTGPQPGRPFVPERSGFNPSNQIFPDNRNYPNEGRPSYPMENPIQPGYQRSQPPQPFSQDPRYVPSYVSGNENGAQPGYPRPPNNYYGPISSPYDPAPIMATAQAESPQYRNASYQQPPPGRDPRDQRYSQPEYADPRYAYPSPAVTVSSVNNTRESITSPAQQSNTYSSGPPSQYDQYGNRRSYR